MTESGTTPEAPWPRAILFDLDDTLLHRSRAFERYLLQLRRRFPRVLSQDGALETLRRLDQRGSRSRRWYCQQVAHCFPGLGLTPGELWDDLQRGVDQNLDVDPEVVAMLQRLGQRAVLAVVSNGNEERQRARLERAGLAPWPGPFCVSSAVGAAKPSPEPFLLALEQAGATAEQALFVGDDPLRDIQGASRVGLRSCWVAHGRRWPLGLPQPWRTIEQVTQLEQILS